jgi:hypothetical protein
VDTFELDVLAAVTNDFEAVHTIRGDLERDLGRSVSVVELSSALVHLGQLGFVDAFTFDRALGSYRKVHITAFPPTDLWFLISALGRTEYERRVA